ncbi:leydig cell tumor 10 kDa protein homolog isoform X2 [Corvus kubaryi]|uniref:leydig cell tumor 10 kDa protein homolog isoform X2 n=1 Tax=Corvus moneduloides TaxID=1196302 RepID=UPI00136334A0|nr:leydig cell tumor 10 kDa protein homolog isoform X2 [Corvus moneduloides]XP_041876286.1 leydig cell tumor 10 kDa protein homolog isoform X2 [Corvus kubaryi]
MAQGRPKVAAKRPKAAAAAAARGTRGPRKGGKRLEVGIRMRIERETVQRAQGGLPKKLALVTAPGPAKGKAKKGRG